MTPPRPVLTPEHGELCATLFTDYAKREGLLARLTEEQFAEMAKVFMYGFACGVGAERGDQVAAEAVRLLRGLER